jgi:hypothetical protein
MRFENANQPVEASGHKLRRGHIGQSSRTPAVEGWQQNFLGALEGRRIVSS